MRSRLTGLALAAAILIGKTAAADDGRAPAPVLSPADRARLEAKAPQTVEERHYQAMSTMGAIAAGLLARPDVATRETQSAFAADFSALAQVARIQSPEVIGSADIIVHGTGDVALQSETSIASNPAGTVLIAGYNDARGFSFTPLSISGVARSTDGGLTWSEVPVGPGGLGLLPSVAGGGVFGDPDVKWSPTLNSGAGGFVYSSIFVRPSDGLQGTSIHTSSANGLTWSGPIQVTPAFVPGAAADKEFIDVNPVTGRILMTWSHFTATSVDIRRTFSDNGGMTWAPAVVIGPFPAGGFVQASVPRFDAGTTDADSKAYAAWRKVNSLGQNTIAFSRSLDGGATWSAPMDLTPLFASEDQVLGVDRVNTSPSLAVNDSTGQIYVVYQRNNSVGTGDIAFQTSTNNGMTFTPEALINSNPGGDRAQFYPWVTVDQANGRVHVTWYDQDPDASGDLIETLHTVSSDGGATWSRPAPLNDRPFHAGYGNDTSQPNIGDYNQSIASNGLLHSLWGGTSAAPRYDEGQPSSPNLITPDTYYDQLSSQIVTPLRLTGFTFAETNCAPNGNLDSGEIANFTVTLENYVGNALAGATTITSITATLSTTTPRVSVTTATSAYPDIPPMTTAANTTSYTVTLASNFVPGTYIDFVLTVTSVQGMTQLPFRLATGTPGTATTLINENFEGVTPPALPAGWSSVVGGGSNVPWITSNTLTPTNAAFHANGTTTRFIRLFSPAVAVPTPAVGIQSYVTLDFDIVYKLEHEPTQDILAYDGLTVRITDMTPGATLRSVLAEAFAETFTTGAIKHFPKHLPRFNNPAYFEDMSVWSGDSGGMVHVSMKFPGAGLAGRTIQLRFEYTEDPSLDCTGAGIPGPCGVAVDNIVLRHVQSAGGPCSPLSVNSMTPTSGPSAGGSNVAIIGTSFQTGASATIGSVPATGVSVPSSIQMNATTPALSPGTLNDVVVTNPDSSTATLTRGWLSDFLDVPSSHPFHDFVEKIFRNGITSGCGGGDYCPDMAVPRDQMAVFLLRGKHGGSYVPPPATGMVFNDVPISAFAAAFIEQLFAEGITSGCSVSPPLYCPASPVTRGQMAVFLLRARLGSGYMPPPATGIFGDVPPSDPFAPWIEDLFNRGITAGCSVSPLLYCPNDPNTRGQMAVFLTRTFNLP